VVEGDLEGAEPVALPGLAQAHRRPEAERREKFGRVVGEAHRPLFARLVGAGLARALVRQLVARRAAGLATRQAAQPERLVRGGQVALRVREEDVGLHHGRRGGGAEAVQHGAQGVRAVQGHLHLDLQHPCGLRVIQAPIRVPDLGDS
jgi:hypothetical protein